MTIQYITGRSPECIPAIGARIPIVLSGVQCMFQVDAYGSSEELTFTALEAGLMGIQTREAYKLELEGHIVLPAGSAIADLMKLLGIGAEIVDDKEN